MRMEEVEKQTIMEGDPTLTALLQPVPGRVDKGYGQDDLSPEKPSGHHHLDMGPLPPAVLNLQGWVTCFTEALPSPSHRA